MATRFYLPSSGTSPLNSLAVSTQWEHSGANFFRAPTFQDITGSTLTDKTNTFPDTTTDQMCFGQWTSAPLAADFLFLTSHTISMVVRGVEANIAANAHLAYTVRVVSNDGSTVRGSIAQYHATSTELTASVLTRIHSARVLNTQVQAYRGDRIVIELGSHGVTPSTSYSHTWRFGDPAATAAFALTAGLTTDLLPWVELSPTLSFQSAGVPAAATGTTGAFTADQAVVSTAIVGDPTYIKKVKVKLANTGSSHAACNAKAILYTIDGANGPKTLLGTSDEVAIADNAAAAWVEFTFATPTRASGLASSQLSLGVITNENGQGLIGYYDSVSGSPRNNTKWYWADDYTDGPIADSPGPSYTSGVRLFAYASEVTDLTATVGVTAAAAGCAITAEYVSPDRTATVGVTGAAAGCAATTYNYGAALGVTTTKAAVAVTAVNSAQATVGVTGAAAGCAVTGAENFTITIHEPTTASAHYKGDDLEVHFSVPCRMSSGRYYLWVRDTSTSAWYGSTTILADGRSGDYEITMSTLGIPASTDFQAAIYWSDDNGATYPVGAWTPGEFSILEQPRSMTIGVTAAKASTAITAEYIDENRTLNIGVTGAAAGTQISANNYKLSVSYVTPSPWQRGAGTDITFSTGTQLPVGHVVHWWQVSTENWYSGWPVYIEANKTEYTFNLPNSSWLPLAQYEVVACYYGAGTDADWAGAISLYNWTYPFQLIDVAAQVGVTAAKAGVAQRICQMKMTLNSVSSSPWFLGGWYKANITFEPAPQTNDHIHGWLVETPDNGGWYDMSDGERFLTPGQATQDVTFPIGGGASPPLTPDQYTPFFYFFEDNIYGWSYSGYVYGDPVEVLASDNATMAVSAAAANSAISAKETFASAMGVTAAAAGTNLTSYVYWAEIAVRAMAAGMNASATLNYLASLGCSAAAAGVAVSAAETFVMTVGVTAAKAGTAITVFQGLFLDIVMIAAAASVSIDANVHRYPHPHQRAGRKGAIAADLAPHRARQTSGIIVDSIAHRATQKKGAVDGFDN
jgi:hypothetical protein